MNAIDRPKSHTVKFALKTHVPNAKCVIFVAFCAFNTEIKPGVVMSKLGIGKSITTHVQLKIMIIIFGLFTVVKIS